MLVSYILHEMYTIDIHWLEEEHERRIYYMHLRSHYLVHSHILFYLSGLTLYVHNICDLDFLLLPQKKTHASQS